MPERGERMTGLSGRIGTCIPSAVVIVLIGGAGGNEDDGFRPIFDGKTLDSWISDDDPNQFDAAGICACNFTAARQRWRSSRTSG
jgi:hypothetical protein